MQYVYSTSTSIADIISTVEFDSTGNYLATGDRGGRVVLFERNESVSSLKLTGMLVTILKQTIIIANSCRWSVLIRADRKRLVNTSSIPNFRATNQNLTT